MKRRDFLSAAVAAVVPIASVAPVFADRKFPSKPIRLVVPFAPGSGSDFVGRIWAERARPHLGALVVENQSGGAGSIGGVGVARAKPDGHTLLVAASTTFVLEMLLKRRQVYNPVKELAPVCNLAISAFVMAVNPAVPVNSLRELADYAAANSQKRTFGSGGVGSMGHLTGEMFKSLVSMLIAPATDQVIELHNSGKIKILAVTSPSRLFVAPEIPTAVESGVPGLVVFVFIGLFAPRGTPKPVIEHIAQVSRTAMAEPAYQQKLLNAGYRPDADSTSEKLQGYIRYDLDRWAPLIKHLGLKLD